MNLFLSQIDSLALKAYVRLQLCCANVASSAKSSECAFSFRSTLKVHLSRCCTNIGHGKYLEMGLSNLTSPV